MRLIHIATLYVIISILSIDVDAQQFRSPLDIPILLSGNFGELRSNHFHSGIDFKTQGTEGKSVHTAQKGYISRISVSPWGYGNALYVSHPDGTTTVYAHLKSFSKKIAAYVKRRQYEMESFKVDLTVEPDSLIVESDEVIALSGNTGSSGGPHLHFEIRDSKSEEVWDPLPYFSDAIDDNKAPKILGVQIEPIPGKGVVNGSSRKLEVKPLATKGGAERIMTSIRAWGEIGIAVKAFDYMDNTSNVYGVKEITLEADSQIIFHSFLDKFAFDETRYLNSFTDFDRWKRQRSFYMRSFIEPGNRLRFIESERNGLLRIDEERVYRLHYTLADAFGNTTTLSFQIEGVRDEIPAIGKNGREHFRWSADNRFGAKGIRLFIPKGNLYRDIYFRHTMKSDSSALAATHRLHDEEVALHGSARLSLFIRKDTLMNKKQYGIVKLRKGGVSWIGGLYRDGWIDTNIRELGSYTIMQDTKAPTIIPINHKGTSGKQLSFRLSDNLSGVESYRGEIDGKFALFEMDNRSIITYRFDPSRLSRGRHKLKLTVTDACGNRSVYNHEFAW